MNLRLPLVLLLLLVPQIATAQQDLHKARSGFRKAIRSSKLEERKAGIEALVQTKDARATADLKKLLFDVDKKLRKLSERIAKLGKKTAGIFKGVDKQGDAGRPVSQGTYDSALKKAMVVQKKLEELQKEQLAAEAWQEVVLSGIGRLIDALPPAERASTITDLSNTLKRSRKLEEQLLQVKILNQSASSEAQSTLSSLAATVEDGSLRVAVIDAIAQRHDPKDIPVLGSALSDEVWPVRIGAARALGQMAVPDAIPPLMEALDSAEGRALEEIIHALENHAGRTFHDNATLWKTWWKENEKQFRKVHSAIGDGNPAERVGAMFTVGDKAWLTGARMLLLQAGIGPAPKGTPPWKPEEEGSKEEGSAVNDSRIEAVGSAISKAPKLIRERAEQQLLLSQLSETKELAHRHRLISFFGAVQTESALKVLEWHAGNSTLQLPEAEKKLPEGQRKTLREAAISALGNQGRKEAVGPLRRVLTGFKTPSDLRKLCALSLGRLKVKQAIPALIEGLKDKDQEVKDTAHSELCRLTQKAFAKATGPWRKWWKENEKDFVPKGGRPERKEDKAAVAAANTSFYGIETRSKHIVFILDRSGSMQAPDTSSGDTRMDEAKGQLTKAIGSLPKDATFNIIFYNSGYEVWEKKMTVASSANRTRAASWVNQLEPVGFTNIFDPIEKAFELAGRGTFDKAYGLTVDTIFFMSDGLANRGRIVQPIEIVREVGRLNTLKKVKIHTIGVGKDHDRSLMKGLADLTGGTYVSK